MADVGLTHVALPVRDLEASLAFYAKYAGMEPVHRRSDANRVAWVSDGTRPFVLVLIETERVEHPLRPIAHLGVACPSREAIDRLVADARREGRSCRGPEEAPPPVGYWALIADPDEHTLELSYGQEVGLTVRGAGESPQEETP